MNRSPRPLTWSSAMTAPIGSTTSSVLGRFLGLLRRHIELQRATDTLLALDDRLLEDIELDRAQVRHAVRHGRRVARATRTGLSTGQAGGSECR